MAKVEIYTSPTCGFCWRAKSLLQEKGVEFQEIDVTLHPRRWPEMMQRANGCRTVPQIFIGETHVGGCDELYALEQQAQLNCLLNP